MKKEYKINKDGLCIVAVNAFTQVGEFCDKQTGSIINGLITTTELSTSISKRLVKQLGLKVKTQLDGKTVPEYTLVGVSIPAIWGKGGLGLHPFIFDENVINCDIILGCDFLSNVNFERIGKENVFILSSVG